MVNYTKAFEKYWNNASGCDFHNLDMWEWAEIKRIAFRAWKAGRKYEYNLIGEYKKIKSNLKGNGN